MRNNNFINLIAGVCLLMGSMTAQSFPWSFPEKKAPPKVEEPILVEPIKWGEKEIKHVRVVFKNDPSSSAEVLWQVPNKDLFSNIIYMSVRDHGQNIERYEIKRSVDKVTTFRGINSGVVSFSDAK